MDQKKAIASLHASMGLGQRKARPSPAAKRKEIQAGQVAVLENVLSEIRRRVRETPAWANAYNSAATVVELELAAVRKGVATPAAQVSKADASELPSLPKAERELIELHQPAEYTTHVCTSARFTADQMHAYGELCRDTKLDESDGIYRAHVEDWATKAGWTNKAEGAFEFAQRTCYRQGWNDAVAQLKHERRPAMKLNDTQALGYVDGRAVFVGAELEQLTRKGWVRHNAQESWRGQSIDWKNDFRWPAEGVKPLFKLDRLDSLIHQLVNVTSDLHRSIQPAPNYGPKDSIRHLSPCDECAGTGSMGPDINPAEMDCEVCGGTGNVSIEHYAPAISEPAPAMQSIEHEKVFIALLTNLVNNPTGKNERAVFAYIDARPPVAPQGESK